jgi:type I restriction enzyme S subunit
MAFTTTVKEVIASDKTGFLAKHPSWERVLLSEIATILNGAPFDSGMFSNTEGVPLIRIRDIQTGMTSTYYRGTYDELFLVNRGDLLIGMDGDFNSAYWASGHALLNQRVCKITPIETLYSQKFLAYLLPGYLSAINQHTSAITVKHLSSKTIGDIELPLPPRSEQTRIVEKLEELLSDLDAGVAELKAAQKKLVQYRQSLLKAAVEGALTAEWRTTNQAKETGTQLLERILIERRARWEVKQLAKFKEQGKAPPKDWQNKYPEPVKPDISDLPELPEGWVWASVDMMSEIQGGIQKQPSRMPTTNKFPFLRVANVARGRLKLDEIHEIELFSGELDRLALQKDDILIVEGNGSFTEIGRCALWDGSIPNAVHQNHLIRARPIIMRSEFVETWLNSTSGINRLTALAATTSGLYTLSVGKISKIPVPIPPNDEQTLIINLLFLALEEQKRQELSVQIILKQSALQRKNILKTAFSGQLVPQDPNDEPASVLLERIRNERQNNKIPTKRPRR